MLNYVQKEIISIKANIVIKTLRTPWLQHQRPRVVCVITLPIVVFAYIMPFIVLINHSGCHPGQHITVRQKENT